MFIETAWKKEFEKQIFEEWKKDWKRLYSLRGKKLKPGKAFFSIDTPPPYVNTPIHMGHAGSYSWFDFFARYKRMKGINVFFPLGLDRNGLPIELAAEKKFNIRPEQMSREMFLEYCKKILEESSEISVEDFKRLGMSFNSYDKTNFPESKYYTDEDDYRALTQATFIDLYKRGLIYKAKRVNNYCPDCKTALADAEVIYEERPSQFNEIVFKVKETNENLIIATTRPELLAACKALIFNPNDKRYMKLEGKKAIVPIYGHEVPIFSHKSAEIEKGTGIMMMCSYGDYNDILFFREQKLEPKILIDENGRMNDNSGFLKGLKIREARQKIIETLKEKGLIRAQKELVHRTPLCERSKTEIEFVEMEEFYLKQLPYLKDVTRLQKQMRFYAEGSRHILENWIDSVSMDWAISRKRYYATEIPLWYCKKCGEVILPKPGKYYKPWKESPPIEKCKCGSKEFIGENRVLDTWFDSSISPLFLASRFSKSQDMKKIAKFLPLTIRTQGKDIIRTWLYYTILRVFLSTGKKAWEDVWINHFILDAKGHKMSKSLGNVISPEGLLDKYGAEPLRLWACLEGNLTKDDMPVSYEKVEAQQKLLTKLWNISRFISNFDYNKVRKMKEGKLLEQDKWFLSQLNELVERTDKNFEKYEFHKPMTEIRFFLWEAFASNYLEMVKERAYNKEKRFSKKEQLSAIYVLHNSLRTLLLLMAPVIPFITYKLWQLMYNENIHLQKFPKAKKIKSKIKAKLSEIIALNSEIWNEKKKRNLTLSAGIDSYSIPKKLKHFKKDLEAMHKIKEICFV
jgi:valyl-tRNA synthetase